MWEDVYEGFSELIKSEQKPLFNAMKQDLFLEEPDKITSLLKSIRESRFASGWLVGVGTHYLDNYLYWFGWLELSTT